MSNRNKLQKFAEVMSFPNVYENFDHNDPALLGENGAEVERKGQWSKAHFQNENPITLELACGRGEYSLALARSFPKRNFIGLDIKGARIWKGASIALEEKLDNVAFLRTRIEQIALFFAPEEVSEIWITFPDPFLKTRKSNRRLTAHRFLDEYRKVLGPDSIIHLKTDDPTLYDFSVESIETYPGAEILYQDDDIYAKELPMPELAHKTYYENMHLKKGRTIKYIRFSLPTLDAAQADNSLDK